MEKDETIFKERLYLWIVRMLDKLHLTENKWRENEKRRNN